eukprot:PLAT10670.1.p2 GENE.PLAT10670.1~~PLAT10670.1.p2  ORF type:complete len:311 (+),score=154.28 PLAT10670.1:184-1116(+)
MIRVPVRHLSSSAGAIGFIGLGNMGFHMAHNLVKAGKSVVVHDLAAEPVAALKEAGATVGDSAGDVAEAAELVVTMLPSNPHVRSVYLEDGGIIGRASSGSLLVDCSTIDPAVSREVASAASDAGLRFLDAPVSGGVGGAEAGTLTFMVGGAASDFAEAKAAVLDTMGGNVVHCGDVGTGEVAKLCNNLVLAISMGAVAEAMAMGVKLGADASTLAGIINTSSGRCWSSDTYNPVPGVMEGVPSSRDYEGGFAAKLMNKDVGLALDAAASVEQKLPLGDVARALYTAMEDAGVGDKDFSSIYAALSEGKI